MKKLIAVALIANVILISFNTWEQVPRAAEAGGVDNACTDDPTLYSMDSNGDGSVDITDSLHLLVWMFRGVPQPQVCLGNGPAASSSGLPDTGLATCYDQSGNVVDCASDPCAGQDGRYATGCSSVGRFVDDGDGTVTDNCTGLMWQKDTGNGNTSFNWCSALDYCESLELAGHDDWRLPNVRELQSIVDYGRSGPSIEPVFGALSTQYWSSTPIESNPDFAWYVGFFDGFVNSGVKSSGWLVRAVRTGP